MQISSLLQRQSGLAVAWNDAIARPVQLTLTLGQLTAVRYRSDTKTTAALAETLKKLGIPMPKQILGSSASTSRPRQPTRHRHTPGIHLLQSTDKSAKIRPSA
jgi:hypothetical protein